MIADTPDCTFTDGMAAIVVVPLLAVLILVADAWNGKQQ
jgi:hypothetical protein